MTELLKDIIIILIPIFLGLLGAWIRFSIKAWVKENGHCCLKNGCLSKFKKVMKDIIKRGKIMSRVIVFKKNTPWGTVRDARNNIVYRHVINFVDNNNNFSQNLKDEFIDEQLCSVGEDYKTLLFQAQPLPLKYIDELNIQFTATLNNQNNRFRTTAELEMSDFAAIKINNEIRFYVLNVIERSAERVVLVETLISSLLIIYNSMMKEKTISFNHIWTDLILIWSQIEKIN